MDFSILKRLAIALPLADCLDANYYFTPTQAKVKGTVQFCEKMGMQYFKQDVFF